MVSQIVKLTGVTAEDAQENIKTFGCKTTGTYELVREPHNRYDPNAIRVELAEYYLGYIPREIAKELAPLMDDGKNFMALFVQRNESPFHRTVGLTVQIVEYDHQLAAQMTTGDIIQLLNTRCITSAGVSHGEESEMLSPEQKGEISNDERITAHTIQRTRGWDTVRGQRKTWPLGIHTSHASDPESDV